MLQPQLRAYPHNLVPVSIEGEPQDTGIDFTTDVPDNLQGGDTHLNTGELLVNIMSKVVRGKVIRPMVFLGVTTDKRNIVVAMPTQWGHRGLYLVEATRISRKRRMSGIKRLRGMFPSNDKYWTPAT